ncbi:MAG: hypothetical protein EOR16_15735 [Mesorhizobium sp.]|nr:MAG: hypothetical protein EOR16_15735 [Mesorhizobium sp.]
MIQGAPALSFQSLAGKAKAERVKLDRPRPGSAIPTSAALSGARVTVVRTLTATFLLCERYRRCRISTLPKPSHVAWHLIVRMRRFSSGLAFNCENLGGLILKLTAFERRFSTCELGLSFSRRRQ